MSEIILYNHFELLSEHIYGVIILNVWNNTYINLVLTLNDKIIALLLLLYSKILNISHFDQKRETIMHYFDFKNGALYVKWKESPNKQFNFDRGNRFLDIFKSKEQCIFIIFDIFEL